MAICTIFKVFIIFCLIFVIFPSILHIRNEIRLDARVCVHYNVCSR